jgi:hypothetical protein
MLYVTWWTTSIRQRAGPQQAGESRVEEPPISHAQPNASARPPTAHTTKVRSTNDTIGVVDQIARVARLGPRCVWMNSQPTCACSRPRSAPASRAVVDVRAVRVARLVGEGVVLAVVGDPRDHRALDRRRAERRERSPARALVLKRGA